MAPVRLKTTKQLKAAHQKEMGRPQPYSAAQLRTMERRFASSQKAESIRNREIQKRKNAKLKKERELKQAEIDRRQVREGRQPPEFLWGNVHASQPRLHTFFKSAHQNARPVVEGELKESEREGSQTEVADEIEAGPRPEGNSTPPEQGEATQHHTSSPSLARILQGASTEEQENIHSSTPVDATGGAETSPMKISPAASYLHSIHTSSTERGSPVNQSPGPDPQTIDGLTLTQLVEACKDDFLDDDEDRLTEPFVPSPGKTPEPAMASPQTVYRTLERPASPSSFQISFEGKVAHRPRPLPMQRSPKSPSPASQFGTHDGLTSSQILAVCYGSDSDDDISLGGIGQSPLRTARTSQASELSFPSTECHLPTEESTQTPRPRTFNGMNDSTDILHQRNPSGAESEGWDSDPESDLEGSEHMRNLARGTDDPSFQQSVFQQSEFPQCPPSSQYTDAGGVTEQDFLAALEKVENAM